MYKTIICSWLFLILFGGTVLANEAKDDASTPIEKTSLNAELQQAVFNGELNQRTAFNIMLAAIFAPHLAPEKFQVPLKRNMCGNDLASQISDHWDDIESDLIPFIPDHFLPMERRTKKVFQRWGEDICDQHIDTEHFRINYSSDPENSPPGYPDLVNVYALGEDLEFGLAAHLNELGLGVPVSDGANGGGVDLIDCYYYNLSENSLYGYAVGEGATHSNGCNNVYTGYFAVSTDLPLSDLRNEMKRTSTHELHHLVQYSINAYASSWFKESTARRTEALVWPELEDPRGMYLWLSYPEQPIFDGSSFRKYAPHFWIYLQTTLGDNFLTDTWRRCCQGNWYQAIMDEITRRGSDFNSVLIQFSIWNAITSVADDGLHYPNGATYRPIRLHRRHHQFPVISEQVEEQWLAQETGSNYIRFFGRATKNTLRITFDGQPEMAEYRRISFLVSRGNRHTYWTLSPDAEGNLQTDITDWGMHDEVTLIVTSLEGAENHFEDWNYTYSAVEIDSENPASYEGAVISCAPNPMRNLAELSFAVPTFEGSTEMSVYNVAGQRVRRLFNQSFYPGEHRVFWDGCDEKGIQLSSGTYFVSLKWGSKTETLKVVVLR